MEGLFFAIGFLLGGVCGALGALDLSLIMMHEDDWQSFLRMMDIFLRVNQGVQTGQIVLAIVFYLVLVLHQGTLASAGTPSMVIDSALLARVYGVNGCVETVRGRPMVVVDGPVTGAEK